MTYRAVATYQNAEIAEGFGNTHMEAIKDARSLIGPMYRGLSIVYTIKSGKAA